MSADDIINTTVVTVPKHLWNAAQSIKFEDQNKLFYNPVYSKTVAL